MSFFSFYRQQATILFPDLKKQFESPPYSVSVEAGHSTELRCLAPLGVPPPRVYWLRNNVPVDADSDTLLVSSEGHLLVGQAKLSHQANYTCVAENIAAKRLSDPVSLTVYRKIEYSAINISLGKRRTYLPIIANRRVVNYCVRSERWLVFLVCLVGMSFEMCERWPEENENVHESGTYERWSTLSWSKSAENGLQHCLSW